MHSRRERKYSVYKTNQTWRPMDYLFRLNLWHTQDGVYYIRVFVTF